MRFLPCTCLLIALFQAGFSGSLAAQSFREEAKRAAERGDVPAAIASYEQALNSALKVFKEEDIEVITRRLELGEAYRAAGRWEDAIGQLDYVWKRMRYDAENKSRWGAEEGGLAFGAAEKLGRALQGASRYQEAAVVFATAISDAERGKRDEDEILGLDGLLVDTLLLLDRVEEAKSAVQRARERVLRRHAEEPLTQVRMLSTLATLFYHHRAYKEALPIAEQAADIAVNDLPPGHAMAGFALANLGSILIQMEGRLDDAMTKLKEAEKTYLLTKSRDARELMSIHLNLSQAEALMGRNDVAELRGLEALRIARLHFSGDDLETAKCLHNLANCYVSLKQPGKATDLYANALKIMETNLGRDHPQTVETREMLELARKAMEQQRR